MYITDDDSGVAKRSDDRPPASADASAWPRRPVLARGTLVAAALCVFMAQFGLTVPASLNGLFQTDFSTSASELTWMTDAFLVPVTVLELSFGLLGDMFGRRRLLVGGALLVALGFAVCVATPGAGNGHTTRLVVMWAGQFIAGIGAAAVIPTTLAMVTAGTHTPRARARGLAVWAGSLSTGSVVSPVVCGLAAKWTFGSNENSGWKWACLAVVVLALVSAATAALVAQDSSAPEGRAFDWPGQITIGLAVLGLLYAVIQGPTSGWGSRWVIAGFVVSVVFGVLFVMAERRSGTPLLRMDLFANRSFSVAAVVTVVGMFTYLGTGYITSIRLTAIQGFSPLAASVAFVVFNGVSTIIQLPIAAWLIEKYNPKWVLGGGLLLIAVGDFWMASISAQHHSVGILVPPLIVAGAGVAFALTAVTAVVVNTVPNHLAGMAAGWASLLRDFGFTLGPAVVGAIALSRAATEIHDKVTANPTLAQALSQFNSSVANAPAAQKPALQGAIGAVNSGPLGANGVPGAITLPDGKTVPFNPLKETAFHALDNAYSLGFLIVGICALVAAVVAMVFIGGRTHDTLITTESLIE